MLLRSELICQNDGSTSMRNHTRTEKVMIREQYAVTVRMKMTGDLAWAAGHGKWHVPPQAEGVFAREKKAAKYRP
ncbi:hypothetical protein [Yersinia mollaretii]|uniref:hypothetical protein n=1 Tax=Yersinia mollaretii TaxID=33060 RepID=UPI0025AAF481|nr:hypothetical protein [Yersinia mollaretii]MDN0112755.1 hypothetical protein [Yersinia mollaretii]